MDADSHPEPMRTMLEFVFGLPDQLEASEAIVAGHSPRKKVTRAVLCGMGGSSIAGELIRGIYSPDLELHVERGYRLPSWLDAKTLLIFSSYSGNTEETLAAYDDAKSFPRSPRVVIGSGGALFERARGDGVSQLRLPGGLPPRCALGYGLGVLRRLLALEDLLPAPEEDIAAATAALRRGNESLGPSASAHENRARRLARRLYGRLPVLYASSPMTAAVARRWSNQLNENAKVLAHRAQFPELDHNEIMGWSSATSARSLAFVLVLRDAGVDPRIARRIAATRSVLSGSTPDWDEVESQAERSFARALELVQFGDYLSVYLAGEGSVDPIEIGLIQQLKQQLAEPR
jgi:glucose/mannose-6-phosphate isomerase